jgi:hypothetical protein
MNHRIQEIAVKAWHDCADINVPTEEWMARFIEKLGQYLIEECVMVVNTDITAHDDFGPNGGKAMKRAGELIKNYFGVEDETHN